VIFNLHVRSVKGKGVQCTPVTDTGSPAFWLPRGSPVTWSAEPVPGAQVRADLPRWLAQKHSQLVALRAQHTTPLYQRVEIDPDKAQEPIPMTNDHPEDAGKGFLARNEKREKPTHPQFTGKLSIHGTEYRLAAWVREKEGKKYFSIAVREVGEQQEAKPRPPGRPVVDDSIPF
jgi:hypothetical protein